MCRSLQLSASILASLLVCSAGYVEVPVNYSPPSVPVPAETACTVLLFNRSFQDTKPHVYEYPDVAQRCGESWAKVVLNVHCGVTPFRQYDRSLFVFLKGVNIFAGTSQEPNHSAAGAAWDIQADLSHYGAALLLGAGNGAVEMDNVVNSIYTGVDQCSATIRFFSASELYPAFEKPATHVVSLGTSYRHADGNNNSGNSSLSATISSLPRNTVRAELEMTLQNQQNEEFFWSNASSAWRAALLRIDGTPAGVVPAFPLVYTGGNNPALWRPTPGVQTLRMLHRRLDLTPVLPMLSDGKSHTIQIDVGLAGSTVTTFFYITGTVLAWADSSLASVTGSVMSNSLENCLATSCLAPTIEGGVATKVLNYSISGSQRFLVRGTSNEEGVEQYTTAHHLITSNVAIQFRGDGVHHNTTTNSATTNQSSSSMRHWTESFNMYFPSPKLVQQRFDLECHGCARPGYSSRTAWTDSATANSETTSSTSFSFNDNAGNKWERRIESLNGVRSSSTEAGSLQWWSDPFFGMRAPPSETFRQVII